MPDATQHYQDIILTHHAVDRARDRTIDIYAIADVIHAPDRRITLTPTKTKFLKVINNRRMQVVATFLPQDQKWLVISAWVRGEEDQPSLVLQILESLLALAKTGWRKLISR